MARTWTDGQKREMSAIQRDRVRRERARGVVCQPPKQGEVNFHCSVKLDVAEMRNLSAEQTEAVMIGIANVLNAA